jgi:tetratricopeptide (TPR) repeat protein
MKSLIFLFLTIGFIHKSFAQKAMMEAFSKSYQHSYNKKYDQAVNELMLVYNPKNYEVNLRLGYVFYLAKDYVKSKKYYQIAIDLMPLSVEAKLGMAYPLAAEENNAKLIEIYNSIISYDIYNSYANYFLGMIYYKSKDYTAAQKCFERNVNTYPFTYDSVIMLGWTYLKMGKTNEAKVLFYRALTISPDDVSATNGLGFCE